jgi:hypothetical protein
LARMCPLYQQMFRQIRVSSRRWILTATCLTFRWITKYLGRNGTKEVCSTDNKPIMLKGVQAASLV